jgi:coproporphyrinogen III oxidase-like Fe-S oxidoreductase
VTRAWRAPAPADEEALDPGLVFEAGLRNHHVSNTAYPIAHGRTWAPYRVSAERADEAAVAAWAGIDDLSLYVHIPFCETRCSFCEYTVVKREEAPGVGQYMDDLRRELALYRAALGTESRRLHGFDIGGGTPSFVPAEEIASVVEEARAAFQLAPGADISIETTPRIAADEPAKLRAYRRAGIGRISMGVQVVQPDLLRLLNREANGIACHRRAVDNIRAAGFARFNVDLMYGFAGQTPESWRATLQHAIGLGPEYVTLYRMRYKLTRISHQAPQVTLEPVRALAALAKRMLQEAGYHANPGKTTYSRLAGDVGTSSYLARRVQDGLPYLGLGLGAQSFTHTTISYNDGAVGKNLFPYHRSLERERLPLQDLYDLPRAQMAGKMCAVSFYFGEIRRRSFREKFGLDLEDAYPAAVDFVLRRGLMEWSADALSLTRAGAEQVNGVIALFFAPSIQRYLVERDPDRAEDLHRNRAASLKVAGEAALA